MWCSITLWKFAKRAHITFCAVAKGNASRMSRKKDRTGIRTALIGQKGPLFLVTEE
jgi:hypothetical protein